VPEKPSVSRKVPLKDKKLVSLCETEKDLGLMPHKVAYSNLGNHGPDHDWMDGILYSNVYPSESLDMGLTSVGPYYPYNTSHNRIVGDFAIVNLNPGSFVELKLQFKNRDNEPATVPEVMLTFAGFDMLPGGQGAKELNISGHQSYAVTGSTAVNVTEMKDWTIVRSQESGVMPDFPHALDLTKEEMDRAVVFRFKDVSEIYFTLRTSPGPEGRDFYIGGQSNLVCDRRARCDSMECPAYFIPRKNWEDLYCEGKECTADDVKWCCLSAIPEQCWPKATLMFPPGCVLYSNLGGEGPDFDKPHEIRYHDVFPQSNVTTDLIIRNTSEYTGSNVSNNGQHGEYGVVNVAQDSYVNLTFKFVDSETGKRRIKLLDGYHFTIYDFDNQKDGHGVEIVTIGGFSQYSVSEGTTVTVGKAAGNMSTFQSTAYGDEKDNPESPFNLTKRDVDKTVSFFFSSQTNKFDLQLSVTKGWSGRNFEFTGYSTLPCPEVSLCSTFSCPDGWKRLSDANERMCKSMPCTDDDDLDQCCVPVIQPPALCTTMVCPRLSILRPEADVVYCAGSECKATDTDTCCLEQNCEIKEQLNLSHVVTNNFAGSGPGSGEEAIVFKNVFPYSGRSIDMHVSATKGHHLTWLPEQNGLFGHLGRVNLRKNTTLQFQMMKGGTTDPAAPLDPYFFSFLAFSQEGHGGLDVRLDGAWGHIITTDDTKWATNDESKTLSSPRSTVLENLPLNAYAFTAEQQRFVAGMEIDAVSFTMELNFTGDRDEPANNTFFFAGGSALGCPERKTCLHFECPTGYTLKENAAEEICSGVSCTEDDVFSCCDCDPTFSLEFGEMSILENTIGKGEGGTEEVLISDVFPHSGKSVGLRITAKGDYYPHNFTQNRLNGHFLELNAQSGSDAVFLFQFIDAIARKPFSAPSFFFSAFDLDQQDDGGCRESVRIDQAEYAKMSPESDVIRDEEGWFHSSEAGKSSDNPANPFALTQRYLDRSVTWMMPAGLTEFRVSFSVSAGWTGRNILFSGASNIVCPERALCTTHMCPEGMHLKPTADRNVCKKTVCAAEDTETCCDVIKKMGKEQD